MQFALTKHYDLHILV